MEYWQRLTTGIFACFLVLNGACSRQASTAIPECDVLITGGSIVDGSGSPAFRGNICIKGDCIADIGAVADRPARRRVDASGLVVSPGFIDLLGQSEYQIFLDNRAASKITQGITTEITGESSQGSAAHRGARQLTARRSYYDQHKVPDWTNLESYFAAFVQNRSAINLGTFVSAGGVRDKVVGRADRPATADELVAMEGLVTEAMEMSAFGLSSSLQYVPDRFASSEELIALARVAGRYGGSYFTHQRSEGDQIDASMDEVFRIARDAGVPATIHHLKTAYVENWGRMPQILNRLEEARTEGLDIAADVYPYSASSNRLDANFPVWAREGGRDALLARLNDPVQRARIKMEIMRADPAWENQYLGSGGTPGLLIAAVKGGVKLDHWGGEKVDHFTGSGGFALKDLRGAIRP